MQAFTKACIFYNLDPEHYIQIETDISCYAKDDNLCHLTPESRQ